MKFLGTISLSTIIFCSFIKIQDSNASDNRNFSFSSDTLNFSFKVYNLDNISDLPLHYYDSIHKVFDLNEIQPGERYNKLYNYVTQDSIHFLFTKTLSTCCPDPISNIISSKDSLILDFTFPSEQNGFCDAICSYMFIYSFSIAELSERNVSIK